MTNLETKSYQHDNATTHSITARTMTMIMTLKVLVHLLYFLLALTPFWMQLVAMIRKYWRRVWCYPHIWFELLVEEKQSEEMNEEGFRDSNNKADNVQSMCCPP
jgi:hypothetical protein